MLLAMRLHLPGQSGTGGLTYPTDTWNDAAVAAAWSKDTSKEELPYSIYSASKTEGERALWKFVKDHPVSFAVNTVLPAANVRCRDCPSTFLGETNSCSSSYSMAPFSRERSPAAPWAGCAGCCLAIPPSLPLLPPVSHIHGHVLANLDPGRTSTTLADRLAQNGSSTSGTAPASTSPRCSTRRLRTNASSPLPNPSTGRTS